MKRSRANLLLVLAVVAVCASLAAAGEQTSNVHFIVIRDYNGKPVRNASVVMHPVNRKGQQERSGLQLKTDAEGNTNFDGVPYGPLRIQVLAPGFQTYGEDFQISQPDTQITVKMKRPQGQYSVYESHPQAGADKGTPPADTKPPAASNAPPDASKPETKPDTKNDAKNDVPPGSKSDPPKTDKPQP
jgi:hypothetical protein